jgi:hypothetical protein
MLAPGMIPAFPTPVAGINYNFRCEAVTNCSVGRLGWNEFTEIWARLHLPNPPPHVVRKSVLLGFAFGWFLRISNLAGFPTPTHYSREGAIHRPRRFVNLNLTRLSYERPRLRGVVRSRRRLREFTSALRHSG